MQHALLAAARDTEKLFKTPAGSFSGRVSYVQILHLYGELRALSHDLWGAKIPSEIARLIALAELRAKQDSDLLDRVMMQQTGDKAVQRELIRSQRQRAKRVLEVFKTREHEAKFALSPYVYKWEALNNGLVERTIAQGFARGRSWREIAKSVRGFIDPNVKGGVSYAAKRLARTEIANAYHQQTISEYTGNPFVTGLKWNLSSSHPKPDTCDALAKGHSARMASGVYLAGETPDKPHPQCLCVLTPEVPSSKKFVNQFQDGKYNDYLLRKYPDMDPTGLPQGGARVASPTPPQRVRTEKQPLDIPVFDVTQRLRNG